MISFSDLLDIFWESHNPHVEIRSRQYRNVLFYQNEEQRELAEASRTAIALELGARIATPIEPLNSFTRAEDYHQKYYLRNSGVILTEIRRYYPEERDFIDATSTARLNGYVGGNGTVAQFDEEAELLGLSESTLALVREMVAANDVNCGGE